MCASDRIELELRSSMRRCPRQWHFSSLRRSLRPAAALAVRVCALAVRGHGHPSLGVSRSDFLSTASAGHTPPALWSRELVTGPPEPSESDRKAVSSRS